MSSNLKTKDERATRQDFAAITLHAVTVATHAISCDGYIWEAVQRNDSRRRQPQLTSTCGSEYLRQSELK